MYDGLTLTPAVKPDQIRQSVCRAFSEGSCRRGASCGYSHTMFNTKRVEQLLDEAVTNGGYKDYKPTLEVEYLGKQSAVGSPSFMWRVTLRCVLGYHQKSAPQPVVVTSADLHTAMRLLEGHFSASSGKAQAQANSRSRGHGGRHRSAAPVSYPPSTLTIMVTSTSSRPTQPLALPVQITHPLARRGIEHNRPSLTASPQSLRQPLCPWVPARARRGRNQHGQEDAPLPLRIRMLWEVPVPARSPPVWTRSGLCDCRARRRSLLFFGDHPVVV